MSDISFECPHCQKISTVPGSFAGKRGKCPACKKVIEVPDPNEGAYEDAEAVGGPVDDGPSQRRSSGSGGGDRDCPYCGESIKSVARKCKHCGEYLDRRLRDQERRSRRRGSESSQEMGPIDWVLCILCPLIGCIVGIVALAQGHSKRGGMMIGMAILFGFLWNVLSAIAQAR